MLWILNMAHETKLKFSFFIVVYAYETKKKNNIALYQSNLDKQTVVLHFFQIKLRVLCGKV